MRAAILTIGDELTLGQTLDAHGQWLSQRLASLGHLTVEHRTVPDDRPAIARAVRDLAAARDVLLITGGLGPTDDDLTRAALGDVTDPGADLVEDPEALAHLDAWFAARGRAMATSNLAQAMRPASARILANPHGTAPGLAARVGDCRVYALPGPGREMRAMFEDQVRPDLGEPAGGAVLLTGSVHEFGLGEAPAAERLGSLTDRDRRPLVGTTASEGIVTARVRSDGPEAKAKAQLDATLDEIEARWEPYAYGRDGESLAAAVGRAVREHGATLSTAESCTGGWLGQRLVDVPGASDYYLGGWISYTNELKQRCLDVSESLLREHGAVSEPVARAMALGALRRAGATRALSVTGIAGPDGGRPDKPVGTVFIGLARGGDGGPDALVRRFRFTGDRTAVRDRSTKMALQMLRLDLVNADPGTPLIWEVPRDEVVKA
ncbi:MAG: CinA family nicotinamide mononucleotide deamidase-related protein [Planctomycetota bacterium]|jgi:nicotinamide-nucleotide amidase